ncbi:hypothetical protein FS837_010753 [Tulasnella sp. UAMH 9824]|nr:hypothetical protein FS837_010753 [Tulasnella sp. UAMH 9824]
MADVLASLRPSGAGPDASAGSLGSVLAETESRMTERSRPASPPPAYIPSHSSANHKTPPNATNVLRMLGNIADQVADFWRRYGTFAEEHALPGSRNLGQELDGLLGFASMVSILNASFISLIMPSLSPDPMDHALDLILRELNNPVMPDGTTVSFPPFSPESNSVIANYLFYASLACSLLSAVGAILAKDLSRRLDRTEQVDHFVEKAIRRQRLENVALFLPSLAILSVILLLTGLALYLGLISKKMGKGAITIICLGIIVIASPAYQIVIPWFQLAPRD